MAEVLVPCALDASLRTTNLSSDVMVWRWSEDWLIHIWSGSHWGNLRLLKWCTNLLFVWLNTPWNIIPYRALVVIKYWVMWYLFFSQGADHEARRHQNVQKQNPEQESRKKQHDAEVFYNKWKSLFLHSQHETWACLGEHSWYPGRKALTELFLRSSVSVFIVVRLEKITSHW